MHGSDGYLHRGCPIRPAPRALLHGLHQSLTSSLASYTAGLRRGTGLERRGDSRIAGTLSNPGLLSRMPGRKQVFARCPARLKPAVAAATTSRVNGPVEVRRCVPAQVHLEGRGWFRNLEQVERGLLPSCTVVSAWSRARERVQAFAGEWLGRSASL